jgi:four helix bundle protein
LPKDELFNLSSQIKRAALSVSNNIAEGAARKSAAERKRFYEIARSSTVEVDNCLEVILISDYLTRNEIMIVRPGIADIQVIIRNDRQNKIETGFYYCLFTIAYLLLHNIQNK